MAAMTAMAGLRRVAELDFSAMRRYLFGREDKARSGDSEMTSSAVTQENVTPLTPRKPQKVQDREALAVLEQMFGYFSFAPMPLEADLRQAA
ncbi:hypothetical protein [Paracoccus sp. J56]|uniref:hypothetical protein n=2 Tax=Paracoccus sp. J56 TaxID=935850 RepID=UPI000A09D99C|nr:hypothetical protein [Paracoccus sp. J56]SMG12465.1 hypothetical protein SAMN02746000_00578 [Paracoccus sp. J56]